MVETDGAVAFVMDDILLASLMASSKRTGRLRISADRCRGRTLRDHAAARRCRLKRSRCGDDGRYKSGRSTPFYDKWSPGRSRAGDQPEPAHERRSRRSSQADRQRRPGGIIAEWSWIDARCCTTRVLPPPGRGEGWGEGSRFQLNAKPSPDALRASTSPFGER